MHLPRAVRTAAKIYENIKKGIVDVRNESHGIKLGTQAPAAAGGAGAAAGTVRPGAPAAKEPGSGGGCC